MVKYLILLLTITWYSYSDTLNVDIFICPPLVIEQPDGSYAGFEIDLIKKIAYDNNYHLKFNKVDTFSHVFYGIENGTSDVALASLSMTSDREKRMDFSYSYITTGLGAMISSEHSKPMNILASNLKFYGGLLVSLFPFLIGWTCYVYIIAFFLWLLERKNELFNPDLKDGWMDAKFFVHVVMSSTGFGNQIPSSKWGKRVTVIIMYSGIGFMFPLVTSKISSEMIKKPPYSYIKTSDDLKGKDIAVVAGTVAVGFVKSVGGNPVPVTNLDQAVELLTSNKCDVVVHDSPSLKYIASNNDKVTALDQVFTADYYAVAFKNNSDVIEKFNASILTYIENGYIKQLKDTWF